jgi:uncharacterized membrane protein YgcG
MAGGKLTVEIGADITDFEKKIKEVEFDIKELSKIKLDRLKVGLDTTEINNQIKDAKASLNSLKTAVKDTGQSFASAAPKVANAGNTLTQFSRIAQDAPYGIIGIGNNITATAESFTYLKQQTGSTGGALKALASSLMGTGGILLGVSLLTTGLTYLAQSGLSVGDVIDKITGNTNAYSDALKKVNDEAYASEGVQQAVTNVNQLTTEIDLAKQGFLNKDQVVKHYNETIGKTTGLVKNIEEAEKSLNRNADAYIKMTLYKAVATLALEEAAKKQLEAEKTRVKKLAEFASFNDKVNIATSEREDTEANKAFVREQNKQRLIDLQKKRKLEEIKINENAAKVNLSIAKKFEEDAAKISKNFNFNFFGDTEAPKEKKAKVKPKKFEFDSTFIAPFVSTISGLGDTMAGFEDRTKTAFQNANIFVKENTDKMKIILTEFNDAVNELIQNSIATTFADLGNVIGTALATGGDVLSAIGTGLIQSLGSFLSALGDKLITYGLLLAGFGKAELAFKVGDPVTKIGAGLAMVALGVAAKAAGAAVSSFGGGGLSRSGGGGGGAGANNQSFSSSGFSGGGGGGTVVFEISGQKLIGVLSNTINANRRLGGTLGLG